MRLCKRLQKALQCIRRPLVAAAVASAALAAISTSAGVVYDDKGNAIEQPDLNPGELSSMGVPQDVLGAMQGANNMSSEQEWICTCFLCLANPNGWKSVSECRGPVKKLFKKLRKRHWKPPRCKSAGGSNFWRDVNNPVKPCRQMGLNDFVGYVEVKSGTTRSSSSAYGFKLRPGSGSRRWAYSGEYEGEGTDYCVGNLKSTYRACVRYADDTLECLERARIHVFDRVEYNPHYSERAMDIYIENKFWNRNHDY